MLAEVLDIFGVSEQPGEQAFVTLQCISCLKVLQTPLKTKEEGREEGKEAATSCKQGLLLVKFAWVLQWVSVLSELGGVFTLKKEEIVALMVLLH